MPWLAVFELRSKCFDEADRLNDKNTANHSALENSALCQMPLLFQTLPSLAVFQIGERNDSGGDQEEACSDTAGSGLHSPLR